MNQTSQRIREQIHAYAESGWKSSQIAEQLGISIWTVRKWRQRLKKGVQVIPPWGVHHLLRY